MTDHATQAKAYLGFSRWWQVIAAALAMALVSPYQYVWSSIEGPLSTRLGIPLPALGAVFTLFVLVQAGSQFPVGWWRDRHGPRNLMAVAAVLAGGGYIGLAYATTVWQLYLLYSLGALGVGIVYTVAVNTALKWFPDRRGLTTGVGTMAFAGGSALFVPIVRTYATPEKYPAVLQAMGVLIGLGILIGAVVLRDPPQSWIESETADQSGSDEAVNPNKRQYTWREVLRTWQFWLMYVMFVCVSGAGLMLTAQIISFAASLDLTTMTATISATVLPVAGGAGRLIMGDISDRINRRWAMAISFTLCGLGVLLVVQSAEAGFTLGFIGSVILATFFWAPQYTLFPTVVGQYYGSKHSSANYALLYSGKMWGGVFGGGLTAWLVTVTSWSAAFNLGGVLAIAAGGGALLLRVPDSNRTAIETGQDQVVN